MEFAPKTKRVTSEYFEEAIEALDGEFGEGYARANPGLVGAWLQACATEDAARFQGECLLEIDQTINEIEKTFSAKEGPNFSELTEAVQNIARMLDLYSAGKPDVSVIANAIRGRDDDE
jgi:hypothetical protein